MKWKLRVIVNYWNKFSYELVWCEDQELKQRLLAKLKGALLYLLQPQHSRPVINYIPVVSPK